MVDEDKIEAMCASCPTPFYLFDEQVIRQDIGRLRDQMPYGTRMCYAMKANPFVLETAALTCDLIEVCSPGELDICRSLGISNEQLVISGVHKDRDVMRELIASETKVHRFTVESASQFELLESIARDENTCISVLLRLTSGNQFGMDPIEIKSLIRDHWASSHVKCCGIQFFSGTQKASWKRVNRELRMLDRFMNELRKEYGFYAFELEYGPGISIDYCETNPHLAQLAEWEFLTALSGALQSLSFGGALTLEIGRGIAARCGTYVTRVIDVKKNRGRNYAIVDGGKHQMVYYGQSLALRPPACTVIPPRPEGNTESWAICGSLCTSGDMLIKQVDITDLNVGDCIAFPNAGAYCMTEGLSLFLSRDLPRIYLSNGSSAPRLVRDRIETSTLNTPVKQKKH